MIWTRRKITAGAVALQLVLAVAPAVAQRPQVEQLFPARPTGYVTDVAGVVEPAVATELEGLIARLRQATGAEIAVVTLPTIGEREAAEIALAIGRRWGVGARADIGDPRRNAGIVVLLVPRQEGQPRSGQLRIEVGQGLEGIVPDATANRIYRQVMVPELAREAYGAGLLAGVRALVSTVASGYGVSDSALTAYRLPAGSSGQRSGRPSVVSLLPVLLFITFLAMANRGGRGRRRRRQVYWGGPWVGGGWGGGRGGFGGGGGFGGFGGGGGFSGGGSGGRF